MDGSTLFDVYCLERSVNRRSFLETTGLAATGVFAANPASAFDLDEDPLAEIEILTDGFGVSHVYADDLYSLAYGNGYVQARDRLFQMDAIRLVGRGESANWIGPGQLSSDIANKRDLYTEEELRRQWEAAGPTVRTAIRGFSDGVNRQIAERAATGELPGEFAALGRPPEPWKPTDTVAAICFLIGRFGVYGGNELGNARTFNRLREFFDDPEEAFDAYEDLNYLETKESHYTTIPDDEKSVEFDETVPESLAAVPDAQVDILDAADGAETWGIEADITLPDDFQRAWERRATGLFEGFKWGSNAIVVGEDLMEGDTAVLSGGPQMGSFKPPIPYEVGLHGAGIDVSGMGVVAAPGVIIGQTPSLAWSVTSGGDEHVDTIAVELDPEDEHRYRWEGEWYEMETKTVVHRPAPVGSAAAGEARAVVQEVARIHQDGDEMPVVAWNPEENVAWVQRNSTRYDELAGAFAWAGLAYSDDIDEWERRLAEFPFSFNFHCVDDRGNVSYIHTGKLPERPDDTDLRFPRTPELHAWTGISVGAGLGADLRNPSQGYFINWNNRPIAGWPVGSQDSGGGGSVHRVEVMEHFTREALGVPGEAPTGPATARNELDRTDVAGIIEAAAGVSAMAPNSIEFMIDVGQRADDAQLRAMADELAAWADTRCAFRDEGGRHMAGQGIWEEVRRELEALAFGPELGADPGDLDFEPSNHAGAHSSHEDTVFVDALHLRTNHGWLGDTPGERDAALLTAMERAAETLEERFGTAAPGEWRIEARRTPFDPLGGAAPSDIPVTNRASYLMALEPSAGFDPTRPAFGALLPPSNTGHLDAVELAATNADPAREPDRLTDQLEPYVDYEYKPLPVAREAVEAVTVEAGTLLVTPEPPVAAGSARAGGSVAPGSGDALGTRPGRDPPDPEGLPVFQSE